jgi:hypothetical protein
MGIGKKMAATSMVSELTEITEVKTKPTVEYTIYKLNYLYTYNQFANVTERATATTR